MDEELFQLSLVELRARLARREFSVREVTAAFFSRIARCNAELNAFISVDIEGALESAQALDALSPEDRARLPLFGVPIAVKDLIDQRGLATTAASRVLQNAAPAAEDAACVSRLRRAGAVLIGKTNLHEFAYGGSGAISAYGPARNPCDPSRVCGGSSSGSAAAVAAGLCAGALGTDTAGSIRLPAACCSVVGFKPTHGVVPTAGVIPLAFSYDHVGPLARSVQDAAALFAVLRGEPLTLVAPRRLRCGVVRKYFCDDLSLEVARGFEAALSAARSLGWQLQEVELEISEDRLASNAESYAFHQQLVATRGELYQPATLPRILNGRGVRMEDYAEARRALDLFRERNRRCPAGVDVVLTPSSPILPPLLDEFSSPQARALELTMLRNTRPFNVLGWPTVSAPVGTMVGAQVSAAWGRDDLVLAAAYAIDCVSRG
ncbi:MAG: amidase [Acidobacteriota bacterium]|nr:amidase [Acidobacteriota bacterium]